MRLLQPPSFCAFFCLQPESLVRPAAWLPDCPLLGTNTPTAPLAARNHHGRAWRLAERRQKSGKSSKCLVNLTCCVQPAVQPPAQTCSPIPSTNKTNEAWKLCKWTNGHIYPSFLVALLLHSGDGGAEAVSRCVPSCSGVTVGPQHRAGYSSIKKKMFVHWSK